MTATCTCPPDDCHGGHTIQIGRLTDEHLRRVTEGRDWLSQSERSSMAAELLALRPRVAELESASLTKRLTTVELSKVGELALARLYAERDRDDARARVAELEAADREHSQLIEYLHHAHGIEIDREDDDFREWQQQYGAVTE